MVTEKVEILGDVDLIEIGQLKTLLKDIIQRLKPTTTPNKADVENAEEVASKENTEGMQTFISGFRDKNFGNPEPWDGEDEPVFRTWLEKLSAHVEGVGDKEEGHQTTSKRWMKMTTWRQRKRST